MNLFDAPVYMPIGMSKGEVEHNKGEWNWTKTICSFKKKNPL